MWFVVFFFLRQKKMGNEQKRKQRERIREWKKLAVPRSSPFATL